MDKNSVKTLKSTEVNINALHPLMIKVPRNAPSKTLYSLSLTTHPPPNHKENETINISSILDRIDFYNGALLSPKFSTWHKAIKNYSLQYWPELTVKKATKYTPIYEATAKGHMHAQKCNIRSTKKSTFNKNMDTTISTPSPIHRFYKNK